MATNDNNKTLKNSVKCRGKDRETFETDCKSETSFVNLVTKESMIFPLCIFLSLNRNMTCNTCHTLTCMFVRMAVVDQRSVSLQKLLFVPIY